MQEHEKGIEVVEKNKQFQITLKDNIYYILIFSMSFLVLFFFPFFGSELNLEMEIPNTLAGWILYIVIKLAISALNMGIFYSFDHQGRINVKDNEKYKNALEIVSKHKPKEYKPRSPKQYARQVYLTKGATLMVGTIFSLIGIGNAILNYDYISLISYLVVILMGIVFGIMQMLKTEEYFTTEFYDYAVQLAAKEGAQNDNK